MDASGAIGSFHGLPFGAGLAPSGRRRPAALAVRRTADPETSAYARATGR